MTKRAAIYARASAANPLSADEQASNLHRFAEARGWTVVAVHDDRLPKVGKASRRRPGLATLLETVGTGVFDVVMVESICLIGHDLQSFISALRVMRSAKVRLIACAESIDTAESDTGRLLDFAALMDTYARFGRRERVVAGQQRARMQGVHLGRPRTPISKIVCVKAALASGSGIRGTGRSSGLSPASVIRVRDEMRAEGLLVDTQRGAGSCCEASGSETCAAEPTA